MIGHQLLTKINLSLDETLDLVGLSDELMAQKLKERLEAERVHFATFEGKFADEGKTPDTSARLKATELLGKFRGYLVEHHAVKAGGKVTFSIKRATQRKGPTRTEIDE